MKTIGISNSHANKWLKFMGNYVTVTECDSVYVLENVTHITCHWLLSFLGIFAWYSERWSGLLSRCRSYNVMQLSTLLQKSATIRSYLHTVDHSAFATRTKCIAERFAF